MASSPNTAWEIEGGMVEAVTVFLSLGSKPLQIATVVIKSEDDCFLEGKQ